MPLIDDAILGLIGVNILLALVLVVIYLKSYRAVSSRLTLGLVLFSISFLIENIANLYFYSGLLQQAITGLTTFHLIANFIEMVALLILAWVTWK